MSKLKRMALTCLALLAMTAAAPAATPDTEYYVVLADGQKIGHMVRSRTVEGGNVVTVESMELAIGRGGVTITIGQDEKAIETPQGEPLAFESTQRMGGVVQTIKGDIQDGQIKLTGQGAPRTVPYPAGAMLAEGLRLEQKKRGLTPGTQYTLTAFVPTMMDALTVQISVAAPKRIDLLGRVVTLPEVTTIMQGPTGRIVTTSYVDDSMIAQKTTMPVLGMMLEMIACDKSVALSENDVVDFLDKTLLDSPSPIADPDTAKAAVYVLEPTGEQKLDKFIVTDSQAVRPGADGKMVVTVRPVDAPAGVAFPYEGGDPAALEALKPNRYIESDDERVIALARQAVGDADDAAEAIRRIERFVEGYIDSKNLSVGYASAAEVAESKEGDCSEHALLSAAMCRAVGIPARVVAGYVYVPQLNGRRNVFGGHAWTEAYIGGKWVGLDATRGSFGVGHIAQAVGSGEPGDFFRAISTMGYFKIAKVTVEN